MSIRTPRENDELILGMVKLRAAGSTLLRVAEKHGVATSRVSKSTNDVMDQDIAHSGPHVTVHYWERKK